MLPFRNGVLAARQSIKFIAVAKPERERLKRYFDYFHK